jgi:suppressor of G2 allele of SKP1
MCKHHPQPPLNKKKTKKSSHQWYQLQERVVVDVYAKRVPADRVRAEFGEKSLTLRVLGDGDGGGDDYELHVPALYADVVPARCRTEVLSTKIEVTLAKADASLGWASLEASGAVAAPNYSAPVDPAATRTYPTSAARGPKDWDKVEGEIKDLESKGELDDGDPLGSFFKKIFSQGDEDQRRAMMKSFVESNGTVLSTNWDEVGSKQVECTPPDGMEVHKWSEHQ